MTQIEPTELVERAKPVAQIAHEARADILEVYSAGASTVATKPVDSPLAQADFMIHRQIVAGLDGRTLLL